MRSFASTSEQFLKLLGAALRVVKEQVSNFAYLRARPLDKNVASEA